MTIGIAPSETTDWRAALDAARGLRRDGQEEAALARLGALRTAFPDRALIAAEYALAARALGRDREACDALCDAARLEPGSAQVWWLLADCQAALGDHAAAGAARLAGVEASTRDPDLLAAAAALQRDAPDRAEPVLRARLRQWPSDVAAIRLLGELAARIGRYEDSITLLRRALALAPAFHPARELLARTLSRVSRPVEALAEAQILLADDPANISHRMLLASILVQTGNQDEARVIYQALLAEHPHLSRVWLGLGHVLKTVGRTDDAIAAYRAAIREEADYGEAWWSLANLKTWRFSPEDVAVMRAGLDRTDDAAHRLHLHFALGKALEDLGDHAGAFAHYAAGNALRHAQLGWDGDALQRQTVALAQTFTPAFIHARAGAGLRADDPIFIVGLPRAGSTLVEQILASHPAVEGTMELPDLPAIAQRLRGADQSRSLAEALARLEPAELAALGEEYLSRTRVHRKLGRPRFIDKMPNNWQYAGLIRLILPHAKVIDARRHPLACCFSAFKQHFAAGQPFSYDLGDLGRYYRDYVAFMAEHDRAMPGHVHRVIYEAMVDDTEGEVRRLLDYLGLPFDERCLTFWQTDRAVRTASSEQVRRPIFREGLDQWTHFEAFLGPLKAALGPVLDAYPAVPSGHLGAL